MEALQEQVLANPTDSTTDGEAAKWKPLGDAFPGAGWSAVSSSSTGTVTHSAAVTGLETPPETVWRLVAQSSVASRSCTARQSTGPAASLAGGGYRGERCRSSNTRWGEILRKILRLGVYPLYSLIPSNPKMNRPPACTYLLYLLLDQYYL